jgi:hypothetical protein
MHRPVVARRSNHVSDTTSSGHLEPDSATLTCLGRCPLPAEHLSLTFTGTSTNAQGKTVNNVRVYDKQ